MNDNLAPKTLCPPHITVDNRITIEGELKIATREVFLTSAERNGCPNSGVIMNIIWVMVVPWRPGVEIIVIHEESVLAPRSAPLRLVMGTFYSRPRVARARARVHAREGRSGNPELKLLQKESNMRPSRALMITTNYPNPEVFQALFRRK